MGRERRKRIRMLQGQKDELVSQIEKLEQELDKLHEEYASLVSQIQDMEAAEESSKFTKTAYSVTADNSMIVHLYDYTKTTPIMDSFVHSDKDFLIFQYLFRLAPSWDRISLIVAKSKSGIQFSYSNLTMTDLKKASGSYISKERVKQMHSSDRLYPLFLELIKVGKKASMQKGPICFEKPCLLGGQTYHNQTGFGWEYCGEELVHRGKEYGNTTKFFIIGILVD